MKAKKNHVTNVQLDNNYRLFQLQHTIEQAAKLSNISAESN